MSFGNATREKGIESQNHRIHSITKFRIEEVYLEYLHKVEMYNCLVRQRERELNITYFKISLWLGGGGQWTGGQQSCVFTKVSKGFLELNSIIRLSPSPIIIICKAYDRS